MSEPVFFGDGNTPRRTDTKWVIEQKILGAIRENTAGGGGGGSTPPGGANTNVQYNDAGTFGGENTFSYNKTNNTLTVSSLNTGDATATSVDASTSIKSASVYQGVGFQDVDFSIDDTANNFLVDSSAADLAITLPTAGSSANRILSIKKVSSDSNNITISGTPATIDGAANKVISTQNQSVTLICDGSNWFILT